MKPFVFPPTTETRQEMYVELKIEALLFFASSTLFRLPYLVWSYVYFYLLLFTYCITPFTVLLSVFIFLHR